MQSWACTFIWSWCPPHEALLWEDMSEWKESSWKLISLAGQQFNGTNPTSKQTKNMKEHRYHACLNQPSSLSHVSCSKYMMIIWWVWNWWWSWDDAKFDPTSLTLTEVARSEVRHWLLRYNKSKIWVLVRSKLTNFIRKYSWLRFS